MLSSLLFQDFLKLNYPNRQTIIVEEKVKDETTVEKESWDQKFWDSNPWPEEEYKVPKVSVDSKEEDKIWYQNRPTRQPVKNQTSYGNSRDRYTTENPPNDDKYNGDDSAWLGTVLAPVESQEYGRR